MFKRSAFDAVDVTDDILSWSLIVMGGMMLLALGTMMVTRIVQMFL